MSSEYLVLGATCFPQLSLGCRSCSASCDDDLTKRSFAATSDNKRFSDIEVRDEKCPVREAGSRLGQLVVKECNS